MYVGERCRLQTSFKSLQFVTDNPRYIKLENGSKTIRIQGQATGTATVYVKGRDSGEHLTHIIHVKIIATPPEVLSCTIPAGTECQTRWYDDADTYMMTTSNKNITDISLYRYFEGTKKYEKTVIKGKTPGYAEVYIYKYGVHIGTVKTTVTAPVAPISISRGSVTLKEGEKQILNITNGGGLYQKESGNESIANLRISSTTHTGTISVTGMHYGQTEFTIKDQYFQTARFTARVEDTILVLSHDILELRSSNSEYISARESYKGIKNFTKSNENIRVIKKLLPDGIEVLEVFPERAGETILTVYDNQDNVDTVRVIVGGSNGGGSTGTGKILDVTYTPEILLGDVGGILFQVSGNPYEVGVEYKNAQGITEKEILEKQSDGIYVVAFSEDSCEGKCNDFKPYIKNAQDGNPEYFQENPILAINYNPNIGVANIEDGVKINATSYGNFQFTLKNIYFWKGYDKQVATAKKKVINIKNDYGEYGSIIVSLIPVAGEGYDLLTLIKGKDPITGEQLSDFNKALTVVGLASGAGSGAGARKLGNEAVQKLAIELGMTVDEIETIAKQVLSEYKLTSIADIVALKDKLKLDYVMKSVRGKAILLKYGGIIINDIGKQHIIDRHIIGGILSDGKSIFNGSWSDVEKLINNAETTIPTIQSGGNYQRIIYNATNIGIDRVNNSSTNIYTVITNQNGKIITAFPGKP